MRTSRPSLRGSGQIGSRAGRSLASAADSRLAELSRLAHAATIWRAVRALRCGHPGHHFVAPVRSEAALDALLHQQQTPGSLSYHAWLTPQQFGAQFGPSDADIQAITSWLRSDRKPRWTLSCISSRLPAR